MIRELFIKYSYDNGHYKEVRGEYQSSAVYETKIVFGWEVLSVPSGESCENLISDLQQSLSESYGKDVTIESVTRV